jgi:hypothetical protein
MHLVMHIRGYIQKFPDWVENETTTINTRCEAIQKVMAAKLTRLAHRMAIQLHLMAESYTICSSHSRWPVRKLFDIPSYIGIISGLYTFKYLCQKSKLCALMKFVEHKQELPKFWLSYDLNASPTDDFTHVTAITSLISNTTVTCQLIDKHLECEFLWRFWGIWWGGGG